MAHAKQPLVRVIEFYRENARNLRYTNEFYAISVSEPIGVACTRRRRIE